MAFVDQYKEERLRDPRLLDLIARTEAYEDADIENMGPAFRHAAAVAVATRDGRELTHRILNRRGSPENPISAADVEYKFRNVVRSCLPPARIDRLIELSGKLESLDNLDELIALIAAPRA
jgi:2-methylcitrate dehydratase PrpD